MLISVSEHARQEYIARGDLPALVQDVTLLEFFQADGILAIQQEAPRAHVPWYKRLIKRNAHILVRLHEVYLVRTQNERTNDLFEMQDPSGETIAWWGNDKNPHTAVTNPTDFNIDWNVGHICHEVIILFDQPSGTSFIRRVELTPPRRAARQTTKHRALADLFPGFDDPAPAFA